MMRRSLLVPALLIFATACGEDTPAGGDGGTLAYFPLGIGATWSYRITDATTAVVTAKTSTVEAYADVGGSMAGTLAYRLQTEKAGGTTTSWQQVDGGLLKRLREQSFDAGVRTRDEFYEPFKLRLDTTAAHTGLGATWTEIYVERAVDYTTSSAGTTLTPTDKSEQWTVLAVDESMTVPAGTFSCLHLQRVGLSGSANRKDYWFARDVGKVKEVGSGQTEELASYSLP